MSTEIKFTKYEERGACHIKETKKTIRNFNAVQQARFNLILKYLGDIKNITILDIGCGDGALTYLLCKKEADVIGIDNSELGLEFAKKYLSNKGFDPQFILTSGYETTLKDDSVDCVVLSEIIEHVQHPEKLLSEARRVLRPGGKIIISTPYRLTEKPIDKFHVKEYYPNELKNILDKYFRNTQIKETHELFWYMVYCHEFNWSRFKRPFHHIMNFIILNFNKNPFMKENTYTNRRKLYTQIFAIAEK